MRVILSYNLLYLVCKFCFFHSLDLHPDKLEDYDHDYNKNMNDLGHSFAQTSIKDEPKYSTHNEQSMLDETFCNSSETVPITSQSALVQLLTTNRQLNSIKREFQPSDVGFAQSDIDNGTFSELFPVFNPSGVNLTVFITGD